MRKEPVRCCNGVKTDCSLFDLRAYVTQDGIVDMQLRDMYICSGAAFTPETFVSPELVMARLAEEIADSRFTGRVLDHVISMELCYSPAGAADKTDGMVLTPAWYVIYQDSENVKYGDESFAVFNAVDGSLLFTQH